MHAHENYYIIILFFRFLFSYSGNQFVSTSKNNSARAFSPGYLVQGIIEAQRAFAPQVHRLAIFLYSHFPKFPSLTKTNSPSGSYSFRKIINASLTRQSRFVWLKAYSHTAKREWKTPKVNSNTRFRSGQRG